MRRVLTATVCALAVGCGGSTPSGKHAATVPTATQPRPPSVEVALRGPDTRRVVFGHPLTLKGAVRPGRDPVTVRLLASEYPYPVSEPVQSTKTGEGGSFSFTVQ